MDWQLILLILQFRKDYTIDEIANKLRKNGICAKDEFIKAVVEYPFRHILSKVK